MRAAISSSLISRERSERRGEAGGRARNLIALLTLSFLALPTVGCAEEDGVDARPATTGEDPPGDDNEGGGGNEGPDTQGEGGNGGGEDPGPEVCPAATGVYEVEPAPANVLFLLDRSGSMHLVVDDTTRWLATKDAFFELLDQLPQDTNAGLQVFPRGDAPISCCWISAENTVECDCATGELPGTEARCDAAGYESPEVPVAPLAKAQVEAMKAEVASADAEFYWGTPMAPGLAGAVASQVAKAQAASAVVLITDGNPTSCDTAADPTANDIQRVIDAAASGLTAPVPVRTFVVGVVDGEGGVYSADEPNLSAIALAGGTAKYQGCEATNDCAYAVNVQTFEADLQAALDAIELEAFSCTFDVPEVMGGEPDYDQVNVTVSSDNKTQTVKKDTKHVDGWDYLPGHDTIQIYGPACDLLKGDAAAKIEVVLGCKTVEQ